MYLSLSISIYILVEYIEASMVEKKVTEDTDTDLDGEGDFSIYDDREEYWK